jgi:hypothetical protein
MVVNPASAPETGRKSIHDQNILGQPSQPTGPFFRSAAPGRIARPAPENPAEIHFAPGLWGR